MSIAKSCVEIQDNFLYLIICVEAMTFLITNLYFKIEKISLFEKFSRCAHVLIQCVFSTDIAKCIRIVSVHLFGIVVNFGYKYVFVKDTYVSRRLGIEIESVLLFQF